MLICCICWLFILHLLVVVWLQSYSGEPQVVDPRVVLPGCHEPQVANRFALFQFLTDHTMRNDNVQQLQLITNDPISS